MRSWLYVPANKPRMLVNAGLYNADGIVFDLEDSISILEKDEARILLAEAFGRKIFTDVDVSAALAVRINGFDTELWQEDAAQLIKAGVREIRLPKIESADELKEFDNEVVRLEDENCLMPGEVKLQAIIETPLGVENAAAIACASSRLTGLSFGAEDYCSAMGIERTAGGFELDYPRSRVASAAAIADIEAWDSVWSDFKDLDSLAADAQRARALGFAGKSVIHPSQIPPVNRIFSPKPAEVEWARKVLEAARGSETGAFGLDGKMVDRPVIARAERIIAQANGKRADGKRANGHG